MTTAADPAPAPHLPDTLRLGPAHLTVSTLDGSIAFYERSLGLQLHDRDGDRATMGVGGEDLLVLVEEPGAAPGGRHAGLFHFALLFPTREALARAVKRLADRLHADRGRCGSRRLGGDLPARPRRQRDRALRRPAARAVAAAARGRRARRDLHDRARPEGPHADDRRRGRPAAGGRRRRHGPPAPARRRRRAGPGVLPRRARLRGHGQPRQRGVRLGRRLPPPPRLQRLARQGRQAAAAAHRRPARVDGRAGRARSRSPRCARASRPPASRSRTTRAAFSCATRGRPRSPSSRD